MFMGEIKELNKKYLEELVKLNGLSFRNAKELGPYSEKGVKEYFEFTFKKGNVFGYFVDNSLVGCAGITIFENFSYGDVGHVIVHPKYQRRGIAKELMNFVEEYAKKKKLKGLRLSVRIGNEKAIDLYEKTGFKKHAYSMKKNFK